PEIEYAELNYTVHAAGLPAAPAAQGAAAAATRIPTDTSYPQQWDMSKINMPSAWGYTIGTSNVLVAVIDTGLDLTHPDLATQWTYAAGKTPSQHVFLSAPDPSCPNATTPNDDAWMSSGADFSHGTHVSGTIASASTLSGA